jgi:hypothetical protein
MPTEQAPAEQAVAEAEELRAVARALIDASRTLWLAAEAWGQAKCARLLREADALLIEAGGRFSDAASAAGVDLRPGRE